MNASFPWRRVIGALIAPWFAFVMAGPVALHTCAVHGGMGHGVGAAHDMGAHAGMASHAPKAPQQQAQCNCIGGCCPAAPVRGETPPTLFVASVQRVAEPPLPPAATLVIATRAHVLPFANGPPSRA